MQLYFSNYFNSKRCDLALKFIVWTSAIFFVLVSCRVDPKMTFQLLFKDGGFDNLTIIKFLRYEYIVIVSLHQLPTSSLLMHFELSFEGKQPLIATTGKCSVKVYRNTDQWCYRPYACIALKITRVHWQWKSPASFVICVIR